MKAFLRFFLLAVMLFTLASCGGGSSSNNIELVDSDGDGVADAIDDDDDNDGIPDDEDDFPNDSEESVDSDGDGIGNNADPDDDNDGIPDTEDALPTNPNESVDTDGDGIGNNADPDDDNDTFLDTVDVDDDNNGLIEIHTLEQLDWIRNKLDGSALNNGTGDDTTGKDPFNILIGYELVADLDFDTNDDGFMDSNDSYFDYDLDGSNSGWLPIGTGGEPFTAIFEGNGYSILNLYIDRPDTDTETSGSEIGLFGAMSGADIRNLSLSGSLSQVSGDNAVGALAGTMTNTSITRSFSAVDVDGVSELGGLVGIAQGSIFESYSSGNVTGDITGSEVGGLIGSLSTESSIVSCYASGQVTGSGHVGGLVGAMTNSIVNATYATGDVHGLDKGFGETGNVGGLVGQNTNSNTGAEEEYPIAHSFAIGVVSSDDLDEDGPASGDEAANQGALVGQSITADHSKVYVSLYYANDTGGVSEGIAGGDRPGVLGVTFGELQCPVSANDTQCLLSELLFDGWDSIDDDVNAATIDISPWEFGDSNSIPNLHWEE